MEDTWTKSELDAAGGVVIKQESLVGEGVTSHGAQTYMYQPENDDINYPAVQTRIEEEDSRVPRLPTDFRTCIKQEQTSSDGEDIVMCTPGNNEDLAGQSLSPHLDDTLQTGSGRPTFKIKAEPIVQDTANVPVISKRETFVADFKGSVQSDFHTNQPVPDNRASNETPFPVALYQHKPTGISNRLTTSYPYDQKKSSRNIAVESATSMPSTSHEITSDHATSASSASQKETHRCSLCEYNSVHKWYLVRHMRTHTGEKPYKCSICDFRCARKVNLVLHTRTHTGEKPYRCSVCDKRFAQRSQLATHTKTHTGEKPYKCPLCDYSSCQKHRVKMHTRTHTVDKPSKGSSDNSGLAGDMPTHIEDHAYHTRHTYKCFVCDYSSSQRSCLVSHMSTHAEEKPYKCSVCEYSSAYKHVLAIHMRSHTGEKPFECSVCYLRFANNSNLVSHIRIHTGEKPYKCSECDYCSVQKSDIVRHARKHTGEKPYSCTSCSYRTAHKSAIVGHMRTHTNEKPFKCPYCKYCCAQKCSLRRHNKSFHMGKRPYKCEHCRRSFANKSKLSKHTKTHA